MTFTVRYMRKSGEQCDDDSKTRNDAVISCLDGNSIEYELIANLVLSIHNDNLESLDGAILIFLPGVNEIRKCINAIESLAATERSSPLFVLPLHGALTGNDQSKVFKRPPKGSRKVVASTNVAETSLTIDDIVYVIDSGRIKETQYDATNRMSMLVETWVSRNSARQRRGRAGRVRPGKCFKLYTKKRHDKLFSQEQIPEIKRVPLESLVLQVLSQSLAKSPFQFMDELIEPPEKNAVQAAVHLLEDVDAVTCDSKTSILQCTGLGHHLAKLPMDVRVGKMLVYGALLNCGDQMLSIAASLSVRNPFMSPMDKRDEANEAKKALLGAENVETTQSDHICLLYAFERWNKEEGEKAKRAFCKDFFLSHQSMTEIKNLRKDFAQTMKQIGFANVSVRAPAGRDGRLLSGESVRLVKAAICAGLYPNVINVLKPKQKYTETSGGATVTNPEARQLKMLIQSDEEIQSLSQSNQQVRRKGSNPGKTRVFIHPASVNFTQRNYDCPWMVYREKVMTSKLFIRDCTVISPYCLMFFGGVIDVQHSEGTVTVDSWITLKTQPRVAVLVRELKKLVDRELLTMINTPDAMSHDSKVMKVMRKLVIGSGYGRSA